MTTPRIEETTGEKVRDNLSFIEKLSGKEIVELENAVDEALTQAHQAGIDEAVEKILEYKFIYSDNEVCRNMADNLLEALQDNK